MDRIFVIVVVLLALSVSFVMSGTVAYYMARRYDLSEYLFWLGVFSWTPMALADLIVGQGDMAAKEFLIVLFSYAMSVASHDRQMYGRTVCDL